MGNLILERKKAGTGVNAYITPSKVFVLELDTTKPIRMKFKNIIKSLDGLTRPFY